MRNLLLASSHGILLLLAVIAVLTVSAEHQDGSNDLCYCNNECNDKDHNNSLVFTVMSTFLERAVSKIENLSNRQNEIMNELGNKIEALHDRQNRALNSTISLLRTNVEDQVTLLENKVAALNDQQGAQVNSSNDQLKKSNNALIAQLENQLSVLETKMTALYLQQGAEVNASHDQLKKNNNASVAQLENQVAVLEAKMAALYKQQGGALNASIARMESNVNTIFDQLKKQISGLQGEKELKAGLSCPDGWLVNSGAKVCLKRFEEEVTWIVAKQRCENISKGTRLAVLDSEAKRRFARIIMGTDIWVGARRDDGQFRWLDGQDVTSGWGTDEPSGASDCVNIAQTGYFYNFGCSNLMFSYICESQII